MKILKCIMICLICLASQLAMAQITSVASVELENDPIRLYTHSLTGIPIFKSEDNYFAIHPQKNEIIWKADRWEFNALNAKYGNPEEEELIDYVEFPSSVMAFVGNSIVNVATGEKLVDGQTEEIRFFDSYHLFPSKDLLVVKLAAKGGYKLYAFNVLEDKKKWDVLVEETTGVGQFIAAIPSGTAEFTEELEPFFTTGGDLIYKSRKQLVSIQPESGQVNWSKSLDAGMLLFSENQKHLAIAMERTGLGTMVGLSKKAIVIDASTGEELWKKPQKMDDNIRFMKEIDGDLVIVHDDGLNIFNYETGASRWKKDLGTNGIVDIEVEEEGIMVYNKRKRQLYDLKTGKKIWKKAEKLERDRSVYQPWIDRSHIAYEDDIVEFSVVGDRLEVHNKFTGHVHESGYDRYVYDPISKSVLVLTYKKEYVVHIKVIYLETDEVLHQELTSISRFQNIEPVEGGFFMPTNTGFTLLAHSESELVVSKYKHYRKSGRSKTKAVDIQDTLRSVHAQEVHIVCQDEADLAAFYQRAADARSEVNGIKLVDARAASMEVFPYAFFFTKTKEKDWVVAQVRKADGEEVETYSIDDKTPTFAIDQLNHKMYHIKDSKIDIYDLSVQKGIGSR